jgi:hypothetical protein
LLLASAHGFSPLLLHSRRYSERAGNGGLWVLIAVGNIIGGALIAWKLWRDHPGLGRGGDSALGGRALE